jgi:hypothetical protein
MSCEQNRTKFFAAVECAALSADQLEKIYQANRQQPGSPAERMTAEAKTRALFAQMENLEVAPPTHSATGLPRIESQLGYAAVLDALKENQPDADSSDDRLLRMGSPITPSSGLDRFGRDAAGYDRWGYNRAGFDRAGYDREGYDQNGFDRRGYGRDGYNKKGRNRKGISATGYNTKGFDQEGYSLQGYDATGFDRAGYDLDGYDQSGFDRAGYDREGYDQQGNRHVWFTPDDKGLFGDGRDLYGCAPDGYDERDRDRYGFDRRGFSRYGYDATGKNKWGFNQDGEDPYGFDDKGYRPDNNGREYDRSGYDPEGFNQLGVTVTGYDRDGLDQTGQPRTTRFKIGKSGKPLKAKFNKSGWDQDGYDRWAFHKDDGLTYPDDQGQRRNWMGWIYAANTGSCFNPANPLEKISWKKHERCRWDKCTASGRWRRGYRLPDGTVTGRIKPYKSYCYPDFETYQPVKRDPQAEMDFETFARTIPSYRDDYIRDVYDQHHHPDPAKLSQRWGQSETRSRIDPLAASNGKNLRCSHCGQYTGAGSHHCPSFGNKRVTSYSSGVVVDNSRYGTNPILHTPHNPNYQPPSGTTSTRRTDDRDLDGYDRLGYDHKGFNRQGYTQDGYDRLGFDHDGFGREGYNRNGLDREGNGRPKNLRSVLPLLDDDQDPLSNEDLANLYGRIATGLVGKPRRVVLQEGAGFGTDLKGTITADPYPLGRQAAPQENLVVTRAGIHHELGHELVTPAEVWAQALEIADAKQHLPGIDKARKFLPYMFNIIEDGRMERHLSRTYAGVSEVLAASCRLEPRWGEKVGEGVPIQNQITGALLYTSLPFFQVSNDVEQRMSPRARKLYAEFAPVVEQGIRGSAAEALAAAAQLTQRFEEEGFFDPPGNSHMRLKPPSGPPPGTQARQGVPPPDQSSEQGPRTRRKSDDDPLGGNGRRPGRQSEADPSSGRGRKSQGEPEDIQPNGQGGKSRDRIGDLGSGDEFQPISDQTLQHTLDGIEAEVSSALEGGVRRRNTPIKIGARLHRPLPAHLDEVDQRYYLPGGEIESIPVLIPRSTNSKLLTALAQRSEKHQKIAAQMARQLKAIRSQTHIRLRRRKQGQLDRRQLVNAYKGQDDIRTRMGKQEETSFAVSITVDQSGSMSTEIANKHLYDATQVLAHTLEQMDMAYEVRGFGTRNAQYKAMDDPGFDPHRAAVIAEQTMGQTYLAKPAALATLSLLARGETNRLHVSLTDGDLNDHDKTVGVMQNARRQGVVTFGIFLGRDAEVGKMDEIYGKGNWTTIQSLDDMPKTVGQRIASIFKALR